MRVRIKLPKTIYSKGDVQTFSKDIYKIIEKKGIKNKLLNLNTNEELKRLYTDDELDQTFNVPEIKEKRKPIVREKPVLKPEEMIAKRKEVRIRQKPVILDL